MRAWKAFVYVLLAWKWKLGAHWINISQPYDFDTCQSFVDHMIMADRYYELAKQTLRGD